jgi:hypothetical protein
MGWVKETHSVELIKSNALDRHWIAEVEAKANAEQAHPRSTLNDAGQKPRQLSAVQNKIIGPFDPDRKAMALQPFCERHSNR